MASNGISIEGMDRLEARLQRIGRLEKAQTQLKASISDIGAKSQAKAPYRTGRLKHSMHTTYVYNSGTVEYTAPYAYFVEEGTRYMAGRHYLKPAFYEERQKFISNIRKDLLT